MRVRNCGFGGAGLETALETTQVVVGKLGETHIVKHVDCGEPKAGDLWFVDLVVRARKVVEEKRRYYSLARLIQSTHRGRTASHGMSCIRKVNGKIIRSRYA